MLRPFVIAFAVLLGTHAVAQTPPTPSEIQAYQGLHAAAAKGDLATILRLTAAGADANARDRNGRTALHVAAFGRHARAAEALIAAGADPSRLDEQLYDAVTIAAVQDDSETLRALLGAGASAKLITSPYHGTALIAAAHLGHERVVGQLIADGAPLNHVNNLGWTALIEAVILGNGGPRHIETVRALVEAGANLNLGDRQGTTPLAHARGRGYAPIADLLARAGGR